MKRDRDLLASYFDEIGRNNNLSKETLKLIRYAFIFGELCKETKSLTVEIYLMVLTMTKNKAVRR